MLRRVKSNLRTYATGVLKAQVNEAIGVERITDVSGNYQGIFQWSINFTITGEVGGAEAALQVKFGPSAWYANEKDPSWRKRVGAANADYSRLFITRWAVSDVRQSAVTLQEVLDGLQPGDVRLRDELVDLLAAQEAS